MLFFLLANEDVSALAGGGGWAGAGLLGLVLAWLFFFHLPAKDKIITELMTQHSAEREIERTSRHAIGNLFQKAIADIHELHLKDAEKDRDAFEKRSSSLVMAIEKQTVQLIQAIGASCKFAHMQK